MSGKKDKKKAPEEAPVDEVEASRAPLMDHLVELRTRLVRVLICLVILFIGAWFVTQPGLDLLLVPFSDAAARHGKEGAAVVFTAPLELLFIRLKLAFLLALAGGFPYIAYQVYAFVAPGLYKKERAAVLPFLFVMPVLFIAGAALVYYSVLPVFMDLTFEQEFAGASATVDYLPQVKPYYELAISLLTCFGLAFQLPVVIALLAKAGVVEASGLRKTRKYAYVVIFIVAAIMTPADPFSVWILSVPLCLLHEAGILAAAVIGAGRKRREEEEAKREAEEEAREAAAAKRRAEKAAQSAPALPAGE
ncbi:MAG TPA: twin-arginine translocase subunit TatC [Hyphomonadaceae bacterium]|jgi:sec-independent protein translocase protein TatC